MARDFQAPRQPSVELPIGEGVTDPAFWELDRRLPRWARRSNPIVRRHLGGFLSAPLPEMDTLARIVIVQIGLVAVSLLFPALLEITALVGMVSFVALPICMGMYVWSLFSISRDAASAMIDERQSQALDTLRTTPIPLPSILLSKIAAAIWQQAFNLDTIILATAVLSLAPITIEIATLYPPEKHVLATRLLIAAGVATSTLRLFIEPLMVGALGVLAGSVADLKASAITWAALLSGSYFVLINLPRFIPLPWSYRLVIESALPLALPLLIAGGALFLAHRLLTQE